MVRSIEEQLSGACTTEIAAFDEFTGLLTDDVLLNDFDHVIFDTAPTGHTIRLLQLPGAWSSFIETNPDGASCLGPLAGLEKQRERYAHALSVLADGEKTRLILVARAQQSTLAEVARTHDELLHVGLKHQYLVINGIMPAGEASQDSLASALYQREQRILSRMPQVLASLPTDRLSLQQENLVGVTALRRLLTGKNKPCSLPAVKSVSEPLSVPSLEMLIEDIARDGHGLVMLMGKGAWVKQR